MLSGTQYLFIIIILQGILTDFIRGVISFSGKILKVIKKSRKIA